MTLEEKDEKDPVATQNTNSDSRIETTNRQSSNKEKARPLTSSLAGEEYEDGRDDVHPRQRNLRYNDKKTNKVAPTVNSSSAMINLDPNKKIKDLIQSNAPSLEEKINYFEIGI